jgi:hypothetical protein
VTPIVSCSFSGELLAGKNATFLTDRDEARSELLSDDCAEDEPARFETNNLGDPLPSVRLSKCMGRALKEVAV